MKLLTHSLLAVGSLITASIIGASPIPVMAVLGYSIPLSAFTPSVKPKPLHSAKTNHYTFDDVTYSPLLSEGRVTTRSINVPSLSHPIFIVGTDKHSLSWLKRYHRKLIALHAIGVVVNVKSNVAYQHLIGITHLHLLPINADALAKRFGIHHYPVLISSHLIEQ